MVSKIKDPNELDPHAQKRDVKFRKKHHLSDNRKSVRLIAKLSVTPKHGKKASPR